MFYTRSPIALTNIFAPPVASAPAYLTAASDSSGIVERAEGEVIHELVPSPLYVGIENSRRFRALPLFASLMSLGKEGYAGPFRVVSGRPLGLVIKLTLNQILCGEMSHLLSA